MNGSNSEKLVRLGIQALPVFALIGFIVSATLYFGQQGDRLLPCGSSSGCVRIANDQWASVLGFPTALGASLYFLGIAILAIRGLQQGTGPNVFVLGTYWAGFLVASAFEYRSLFVIKELCWWCQGIWFATLLMASIGAGVFGLKTARQRGNFTLPCAVTAIAVVAIVALALGAETKAGKLGLRLEAFENSSLPTLVPDYAPVMASEDARGTLIAFMDFTCPACKEVFPSLDRLGRQGRGPKVVIRLLPTQTDMSLMYAAGALVANTRFRFADFANGAFKADCRVDRLAGLLDEIGASIEEKEGVLKSLNGGYYELIAAERQAADKLGIDQTPTFLYIDEQGNRRPILVSELSSVFNL